jgi:leucyl-tRNA synthetase
MGWVVIAPDHPDVRKFVTKEQEVSCDTYIAEARSKSDQDRLNEGKEKTGVFTGSWVINPFNGEAVQVWIGDYVLGSYGTGAVMGVAAHDERDFEFAKKYQLPIKKVIVSPKENEEYDALDAKLEGISDTDEVTASGESVDAIFERMTEIEDGLE